MAVFLTAFVFMLAVRDVLLGLYFGDCCCRWIFCSTAGLS